MRTAQVRARFLDWIDHDEALRLMAHCDLLLFPSAWGEPLSRVLLEACACGAPVLAMPTGGTPDIIVDGENGALETTVPAFARRMVELINCPKERRTGSRGASPGGAPLHTRHRRRAGGASVSIADRIGATCCPITAVANDMTGTTTL
jgi:glycosyltransferase involved in cell wall biosynthesis